MGKLNQGCARACEGRSRSRTIGAINGGADAARASCSRVLWTSIVGLLLIAQTGLSHAVPHQFSGIAIGKLRALGDYQGATYDNTLEIHPVVPLNVPPTLLCTSQERLFIDARHMHLIVAAQLALATGRTINVGVDDSLPLRDGA